MVKNLMQDVIPPKRRKQPVRTMPKPSFKEEPAEPLPVEIKISRLPPLPPKKEKFPSLPPARNFNDRWWKRPAIWWSAGGIFFIAGIITTLSLFFSHATVKITPKGAALPVQMSFTAAKDTSLGIPFEVIVLKGSETKSVAASGTKYLSEKASGRIVIYNNYSSVVQKLVKGTRFLAANGKIYRIAGDILVPGTSQKNGETIPGSIEVAVYGEETGPSYNTGLTDFTVPGFKGDPRYDKFYARSKTEITGGFSGLAPVASDKDTADAKMALEDSLKGNLLREASAQVPDGYILYKDAVQINFEGVKNDGGGGNSVNLSEEGTLTGVLLKKSSIISQLTKNLSANVKDNQNNQPFALDTIDTLAFVFGGGIPAINAQTKTIPFSLNGTANITYTVDIAALRNNLAGKAKKDFSNILSGYPVVYKARITEFLPFWNQYFPSNAEEINVIYEKGQ